MSFLLEDLGLATHLKIQLLQRRRDSLQAELGLGSQTKQRLAAYFRQARKELEALFSPEPLANPLDGIRQVFAQRSQDSRKACLRLQKLEADGQLSRPLTDVAESLIHMHVNRILRADHRIQEMILCHFLLEVLRSAAARPARSLENMP
jgi:thiopeptide-type bacteriocin biosynthesis protein